MTNCTEIIRLSSCYQAVYFYDVENVTYQWAVHLKRPCEHSSTKRVQNFTQSTATPQLRTDFWHSSKQC